MRKWLTRCATAAALIFIVLLVLRHQLNAPLISVGKPLPAGRVKPQLINAGDTAVLLAPDGSLWAWGGTYSSLNRVFPQPAISQIPLQVGSDTDWTQIACGDEHTLALKSDGSLWAWGWNKFGQIGQASLTNHYGTPARIGRETNWIQISAARNHSLALKEDGSLWGWGSNIFGQLGDGTTNDTTIPTLIGTDRDWRTVVTSDFNSFALKSNGTIWVWGSGRTRASNDWVPKQIAAGTNWVSISAYFASMQALKTDGTLWLGGFKFPFGSYSGPVGSLTGPKGSLIQIGQDSDWTKVFAGVNSFFARKKDGSWWVCGQNLAGQIGYFEINSEVPSPRRLPFDFEPWAFAPGALTTLMLGKDGKLWAWGSRLGADKPSAVRKKIQALEALVAWRFPSLGFLIKSDIDQTPHLLWELPPEVRRSLGAASENSTNHLITGKPAEASHE